MTSVSPPKNERDEVFERIWVGEWPKTKFAATKVIWVQCSSELVGENNENVDGVKVVLPLRDEEIGPDKVRLCRSLASQCASWWIDGYTILFTCTAGINRSALLACMTMFNLGVWPEDAIRAVREKRSPLVLDNRHFFRAIMAMGNGIKR